MGFRGNNKNIYRPKAPKAPIRLSFGIMEDKNAEVKPIQKVPVQFEKQEIIGTLTLNKVNLSKTPKILEKLKIRILKNLDTIYEEGLHLNSASIIDAENEILKVQFNYNQNTIDRIKGLDKNERQWDPDNRIWKVYIGCFDDLFDILGKGFKITPNALESLKKFVETPYYAHIAQNKLGKLILRESWFEEFDLSLNLPNALNSDELNKSDEDALNIKNLISNFEFKRKPYSHQITGIEFLLKNPSCALLDEMGCGKSFQIAATVAILLENKSIERCLIVAPKSLIHTWKQEVSLVTNKPFTVIEGSPLQRAKLLKSENSIFITHYEGIRIEKEELAQWISSGEGMVVFDESQRIKNINAQTTLSAKFIRNSAKRCVIATGTPIANRPIDLFAQYFVMDNGKTFGSNFSSFKNTFCYIDIIEVNQGRKKIKIEKFIGVRNADELRKRIQATSLRRLKNEVLDLPPIVFKDYAVELKTEQKSIYAKMRDSVRNEIEQMSSEDYAMQANNIVVRLLRLSQIASNPQLIQKTYQGSNAKLEELDEILSDIMSDDTKKVILWSHFVENVNELTRTYAETYGAVAHTGEMNTEKRAYSIDEFQNNPSCRLFIATPQSAKEGLTLLPKDGVMKADTMIYLDLNFDGGSYIQSQARFHRIGQNADKCLIIHLIATHTVDEFIKKTLMDKLETATKILDFDKLDTFANLKNMNLSFTKEEVQAILR